jgi:hypothetical protein
MNRCAYWLVRNAWWVAPLCVAYLVGVQIYLAVAE